MIRVAASILIVDDEPQNCKLLEMQLRPEGYATRTAASGQEAIASIAQHAPDLILLDIMMPGMDGYELTRRIKADPATADIPIIMVTAQVEHSARLLGLQAGAEEFLTKPVDRTELVLRVRNLLRLKALGDFLKSHSGILDQEVNARTMDLRRFRAAMDATADAIMLVNRGTLHFVEVNATACAMLGYSREEFLEITPMQISETSPESIERIYDEITAGHGVNEPREHQFLRKDGTRFPVEVRRHAHRSNGDWIMVGVVSDLTARKHAEEIVRQRADELLRTHQQLIVASRQAGMAEVATSMLHNVGNVLNSVNVSAGLVAEAVRNSRSAGLGVVAEMLREHEHDLAGFLSSDLKGRHIPAFLLQIAQDWSAQQETVVRELDSLRANIDHIKEIVATQQSHARVSDSAESVSIIDLIEHSLSMNQSDLTRNQVRVVREFEELPEVSLIKHKVLQILVNLVRNAMQACVSSASMDRLLTLRATQADESIRISVGDNGTGIAQENLTRIFAHGFTTRKDGHGFGLHSGALAAKELGGSLSVESGGPGRGARFTLELPRQRSKALS
jgi:PAS domain S-box-containing protein